jgi:hypothetical protein
MREKIAGGYTLGKAANYALFQWGKLTRFLQHAELELSNKLGGELDASGRIGAKKLDPRR